MFSHRKKYLFSKINLKVNRFLRISSRTQEKYLFSKMNLEVNEFLRISSRTQEKYLFSKMNLEVNKFLRIFLKNFCEFHSIFRVWFLKTKFENYSFFSSQWIFDTFGPNFIHNELLMRLVIHNQHLAFGILCSNTLF